MLKQRAIPIINENDTIAIEEIKVGDNDTLSAQVASLLKADLLVLLTDVDGLYTANPNSDPNAKHLPVITEITEDLFAMAAGAGSSNGTGGMTTKLRPSQACPPLSALQKRIPSSYRRSPKPIVERSF